VRLARELPAAPLATPPPAGSGQDGVGHEDVYRVFFHGPAYQVLDRVWCENGQIVGRLAGDLPADHQPAGRPTEFAPRLIELCFQTAGIWELGNAGRMALPTRLGRVVRFAGADAPGRLWAVVSPREDAGVDAEVVDETGHVRVRLEGYQTIELPGGVDAEALAPIRTAMGRK
jgi:Polyketide synthase dehydratase